tara:strand:- start:1432 stop:2643 length:1212 start_codon:yes stop_codon:yes gene_type:complete
MIGFGEKPVDQRTIYPAFQSFNDDIDGRVPSCVVENWQHFQSLLNDETDQANGNEKIYRGHRRYDWQLDSKLTREFDGGSIDPKVQGRLLERFLLAMRGRGIDLSDKAANGAKNEVWAYGQHFGLATPLLDWSQSPFVALFFAFIDEDPKEEKTNPYRAVFRLNKSLIETTLPDLFFEPALGENVRLVNQAGLFSVTPDGEDNLVTEILNAMSESGAVDMGNDNEIARYICKYHIPSGGRTECLAMLRQMNIHHASLFPDPGGASLFCNDWLSRCVEENKATAKAELEKKIRTRQPRAKLELNDIAKSDLDIVLKVQQVIQQIVANEGLANDEVFAWAVKIDDKYNQEASIDWPTQQSGVSKIRVTFKRLLTMLSCPDNKREELVEALVTFYRTLYEGKSRKL